MSLLTNAASPQDQLAAPPMAPAEARRGWLKRLGAVLGAGLLARPALARPASLAQIQGYNVYIGEIILLPINFAPRGYAFCNGQLLPINQNQALFSLLGTTYGGNGQTNFALPDLRGATAIGQGQYQGSRTQYMQGQIFGNQNPVLTTDQLPAHTHQVPATDNAATSSTPVGFVPATAGGTNVNGENVSVTAYAPTPNVPQAAGAIGSAGSSVAVPLQSPYLVLNYFIALNGNYPPR
ncbi:MAG: phage tail protein [Janthinobacterium lividum]